MKEYLTHTVQEYFHLSFWKELPLEEFDKRRFAVYVIDYNWIYLFVNQYAQGTLGDVSLLGKNIQQVWQEMPSTNFRPVYEQLREAVENKAHTVFKAMSPLTHKWVEIQGIPLSDCYYFAIKELPDKESLISDLRSYLKKQ